VSIPPENAGECDVTDLRLVADVGGTNCRFALARDGRPISETIRSGPNRAHPTFEAAAQDYLAAQGNPEIAEMVAAVAGPIRGRTARLTNWNWTFDAASLAATFGARVELLNDLSALGYAVPGLAPEGQRLVVVKEGAEGPRQQSLVMGIGTGFNVSLVVQTGAATVCPRTDIGHIGLPLGISDLLSQRMGGPVPAMRSIEDCFSGRGFAALLDRFDGGEGAFRTVYAELMAALARDMMMAFMPTSGIYFAGSVARSVLDVAAEDFAGAYDRPLPLAGAEVAPVSVMLDDAAALLGCARLDIAD
jgi:glucokinase